MATTTNYGWDTPDDTDLVKDGAAAIRTLGSSVDTTTKNLNPQTTTGALAYRSATANVNTALPIGSTGQVLTVAAGVPSWATPTGDIEGITTGTDSGLSGGATSGTVTLRLKLEFDAETGTTYTLLAANLNQLVTLNNASAITLTVPPSVFSAGDVINIAQIGAGQVTLSQGAGVTINSTGATATAPKLRARYSAASIICTASNTFLVVGDIA
jgi:hypothetical protein